MKGFLKNNFLPLLVYFVLLLTALFFVFNNDKKDIHLFLNKGVGFTLVDNFFLFVTFLGDGNAAVVILALILIYNVRLGIYSLASFIFASLFSIGLKRLFFDDVNRPFFIFNYYTEHKLKLVPGVDVYIHNSFPSGHATQAFAIFMCLVFVFPKHWQKWLFLLLALCTAYSRVHLSQHWLVDICAGSMVGLFFSLVFYYFFIARQRLRGLDKSIFVVIRWWRSR